MYRQKVTPVPRSAQRPSPHIPLHYTIENLQEQHRTTKFNLAMLSYSVNESKTGGSKLSSGKVNKARLVGSEPPALPPPQPSATHYHPPPTIQHPPCTLSPHLTSPPPTQLPSHSVTQFPG